MYNLPTEEDIVKLIHGRSNYIENEKGLRITLDPSSNIDINEWRERKEQFRSRLEVVIRLRLTQDLPDNSELRDMRRTYRVNEDQQGLTWKPPTRLGQSLQVARRRRKGRYHRRNIR